MANEQMVNELLSAGWAREDIDIALKEKNPDAKSFKLYTGKAPWPLQMVGGLMWLQGIGLVLSSLLYGLIFIIGFELWGSIFSVAMLVIGVILVKYARAVFKMRANVYKKIIIYQIVTLIIGLYELFRMGIDRVDYEKFLLSMSTVLVIILIFSYRKKFVY